MRGGRNLLGLFQLILSVTFPNHLDASTPSEDDWVKRCDDFYGDVEFKAKCSNGKIICSCLCPGGAFPEKYSPTCCPEIPLNFAKTEKISPNVEQTSTPPPSPGVCTLYRMFDCYKNTTRHCTDDNTILKSGEAGTFTYENGIRSVSILSNCRITRKIVDSMCPNTKPNPEEIDTSGNVQNAWTINQESYECQCSKEAPTTTTQAPITTTTLIPPAKNKDNYRIVYLIVGVLVLFVLPASATSIFLLRKRYTTLNEANDDETPLTDDAPTTHPTSQLVVPQNPQIRPSPLPQPRGNVWRSPQPLHLTVPHTRLGSGAFGSVWKAECTQSRNFFAIKKVNLYNPIFRPPSSSSSKDRVLQRIVKVTREIQHLTEIRSENVVRLIRYWIEDHFDHPYQNNANFTEFTTECLKHYSSASSSRPWHLFLQMEYCHLTLSSWMSENPIETREFSVILRMFHQISSGLSALHEKRIVHRDIKPDNIMYNSNGGSSCITWKIVDLGLSVRQSFDATTLSVAGAEKYRSPEMGEEKNKVIDKKTDIFSLGLTFLEVLVGDWVKERVFSELRMNEENAVFGGVVQEMVSVVKGMLRIEGEERYSILEVVEALAKIAG